jgi:hypothetical protein
MKRNSRLERRRNRERFQDWDSRRECPKTAQDANGCYRDAKEFFYDAIALTDELGLADDLDSLRKRLEHIQAVYRSQFS